MYYSSNSIVYFSHIDGLEEAGRKARLLKHPVSFPLILPPFPRSILSQFTSNTSKFKPTRRGRRRSREQAISFKIATEKVAHTLLMSCWPLWGEVIS